ncbi:MAG: hypothetical protein RR992_03945 [Clostridiales bacterium]
MKKFKIFFLIVALILILSTPTLAEPTIKSECAVVMDMETGQILYAKNPHQVNFMDNMTKLLNVSTAVNNGNLYDTLDVTYDTLLETDRDSLAGTLGLKNGNTITLEDALYGEILGNADDAARVVAGNLANEDAKIGDAHDVKAYLKMMKDEAKYLTAASVNISNVMGITSSDQLSSTVDLANIMRLAFKNSDFKQILTTKSHDVTVTKSGSGSVQNNAENPKNTGSQKTKNSDITVTLKNMHSMVNGAIPYKGVKGGFVVNTESSGFHSVTYAKRTISNDDDNPIQRELVVAIMKSPNEATVYDDTAVLLDYGYDEWQEFTLPAKKLDKFLPSDLSHKKIVFPEDVKCLLPNGMGKGDLIAKTELSENQYCNGEISFTVKNNPQIVAQSSFYEDNSRTPMNKTLKTILTALVALMFLAGLFLLISRIILPFTKKLKTKRRKQQKKHNRSKAKRRKPKYDEAKIKEMEAKENEYFGIKPDKQRKNQDKQHNLQKGQNKENKHKKRNN